MKLITLRSRSFIYTGRGVPVNFHSPLLDGSRSGDIVSARSLVIITVCVSYDIDTLRLEHTWLV